MPRRRETKKVGSRSGPHHNLENISRLQNMEEEPIQSLVVFLCWEDKVQSSVGGQDLQDKVPERKNMHRERKSYRDRQKVKFKSMPEDWLVQDVRKLSGSHQK